MRTVTEVKAEINALQARIDSHELDEIQVNVVTGPH